MTYEVFRQPFNERTLFLDGDWIIYKCAFSLEKRTVKIYDKSGNFVKEYKNKTAFKKDTANYNESYTIQDCQTLPKNFLSSLAYKVSTTISEIQRQTKSTKVIICLQGGSNFRTRLPLPYAYKGNRKESLKPLAIDETKQFLVDNYTCVFSDDEEADDILSQAQFYSYNNNNANIAVSTLDKDNRSVPSLPQCLYHPENKEYIETQGLGKLELKVKVSESGNRSSKIYGYGRAFWYYQLLHGDSIDCYHPCDIYKQLNGITTKTPILTDTKIVKMFENCKDDKDYLTIIAKQYYDWYSTITDWKAYDGRKVTGNWLTVLQTYVDVSHMRRFKNDKIDIKSLLLKLNIIDEDLNLIK